MNSIMSVSFRMPHNPTWWYEGVESLMLTSIKISVWSTLTSRKLVSIPISLLTLISLAIRSVPQAENNITYIYIPVLSVIILALISRDFMFWLFASHFTVHQFEWGTDGRYVSLSNKMYAPLSPLYVVSQIKASIILAQVLQFALNPHTPDRSNYKN